MTSTFARGVAVGYEDRTTPHGRRYERQLGGPRPSGTSGGLTMIVRTHTCPVYGTTRAGL